MSELLDCFSKKLELDLLINACIASNYPSHFTLPDVNQ